MMDRRNRTGEVVNLMQVDLERRDYVATENLEVRVVQQVADVVVCVCEVVVDPAHLMSNFEQTLAEV